MLIGIDGNEANIENRVGVNVYAWEILKNLHKLQDEWRGTHSFRVYLSARPLRDMPKEIPGEWEYVVLPGKGLWIIKKLVPRLYFEPGRPEVFFTPSHYVPPFASMPRVCSIMDLGYLDFSGQFRKKDYWQLRLWTAWSIFVSKRVISISKSTKKNIVRHYKFAREKVDVTPLAYDKEKFNVNIDPSVVRRVKKKYGINENYILFLSTLKPSKNIEGLVAAWAKIEKNFPDTQLVIAGKKGWLYNTIFEEVKRLGLTQRVIFTGYISEDTKPGLIAGAKVFVLPSFWEGFGLDVLSAMAVGVPVIVSNQGSLPEVAGRVGEVVNPKNIDEMASAIQKVLKMPKSDYNKRVMKGIERAQTFDWEKTARRTLEILEGTRI